MNLRMPWPFKKFQLIIFLCCRESMSVPYFQLPLALLIIIFMLTIYDPLVYYFRTILYLCSYPFHVLILFLFYLFIFLVPHFLFECSFPFFLTACLSYIISYYLIFILSHIFSQMKFRSADKKIVSDFMSDSKHAKQI